MPALGGAVSAALSSPEDKEARGRAKNASTNGRTGRREKKKQQLAAAADALKEADSLRKDNASLQTRAPKLAALVYVKDRQIAVRATQVPELQSQAAGLQTQLRKQVRPLLPRACVCRLC
jgi:hypothetical protein